MWQGRARGPESPLPPPLSEVMVGMGYTREEIKEALSSQKYNEVTATYLLLGRKTEVRRRRGHLGFGMPGAEGLLGQREHGAEAHCPSSCRRAATGAPQRWPWQGCGRPATPPMEQAPAKAPATAKGSGAPPPPITASAGTATSVSTAPPHSGSGTKQQTRSSPLPRREDFLTEMQGHCLGLGAESQTGKATRPRAGTVFLSLSSP